MRSMVPKLTWILALTAWTGNSALEPVAKVLAQLDQAAPHFRAATADLTWVDYQAALKIAETQTGTIVLKRDKQNRMQFVARLTRPDEYAIALRGSTAERYSPHVNLVEVYDVAKYRDLAQTLLLLGFGMTGRELSASFEIQSAREETVAGQGTTHLDLTPKSPTLLRQVKHIELWIATATGCAAQQKFHYSDGGYKLATFSNLKLNPQIKDSALEFPRSARRKNVSY